MSGGQPSRFALDHTGLAKAQIGQIATIAAKKGKLPEFIAILAKAERLLQDDPHNWGDPVNRSKFVSRSNDLTM